MTPIMHLFVSSPDNARHVLICVIIRYIFSLGRSVRCMSNVINGMSFGGTICDGVHRFSRIPLPLTICKGCTDLFGKGEGVINGTRWGAPVCLDVLFGY